MLVLGHDHGNMAVGSIVLSVVPIGKLIGTRKSEFAGTPPLAMGWSFAMRSIAARGERPGHRDRQHEEHVCGSADGQSQSEKGRERGREREGGREKRQQQRQQQQQRRRW